MMPIFDEIRASDLEHWATRGESERWMPSLLQQLIFGSGAKLRQCRFLTHEKVNLGGWDGIVEAETEGFNVPLGYSGWELSRTADDGVIAKAKDDVEKRAKSLGELIPAETTLAIVTLRVWPRRRREDGSFEEAHEHKTSWAREQAERLGWRKVVVLDSLDLAAWIARQPGVGLWLAVMMGRKVTGATALLRRWEMLKTLRSDLSPEVFLAGRNTFCETLDAWIAAPESEAFEIRSWSYEEVGDFVAAWLAKRTADDPVPLPAAAITSAEAWQTLATSSTPLLLLADGGLELAPEQISAATAKGHRVILRTHAGRSRGPGAALPSLGRDPLADVLHKCGVDHHLAWQWAGECGGSGVVLKRLLGGHASSPEWANGPAACAWAPIVLFGAWDANCEADRERITEVFAKPYAEVEDLLRPWTSSNHPLLKQTESHWRVLSREDAWRFLSPWLKAEHHVRFRSAATNVLRELNPRYDMPSAERIYAGIYKKEPRHSYRLRRGMAETLCLLANQAPDSEAGSQAAETVSAVVAQVLEQCEDWRLWASLGQALPLLAEAAPDAFLNALEKDLRAAAPASRELFGQSDGDIFSDHPHVELMWALEGLMWERRSVARACTALARLAALDPGGNCSPRPSGVLREAFLPWYPQCCLNVKERCQLIDQLTQAVPSVGWTLLLGLLPKTHDMSSPRHRPRFRDSTGVEPGEVSAAEYWEQVHHVARRLVECVGNDPARWESLIGELHAVPNEVFDAAIGHLEHTMENQGAAERDKVWDALRAEASRHRYFEKADWAMRTPRLEKMEKLVRQFEPADLVARFVWLFRSAHCTHVPGNTIDTPHDEAERHGEEARYAALTNIHAQGGIAAIARLVEQVETFHAGQIGRLIATAEFRRDEVILPNWLESESPRAHAFACGYAGVRFAKEGWPWLQRLGWSQWPAKHTGELASIFPLREETWRHLEAVGPEVVDAYWKNTGTWMHGVTAEEATRAIRELVARGRVFAALDGISSCEYLKIHLPAAVILETLECLSAQDRAPSTSDAPRAEQNQLDIWHLHTAIELLQKADALTEAEKDGVERLEWCFLPLFEHNGKPKRLLHHLLQAPKEFADVVIMAGYKSDDPDSDNGSMTEDDRAKAKACRMLLDHLTKLPGTNDSGCVDETTFLGWMRKAREVAAEKKHLRACDHVIGGWFLHSPVEGDGQWPCNAICRFLCETDSAEMKRGLATAIFNNQGWPAALRDGMSMSNLGDRHDAVCKLQELEAKLDLSFPIVAAILRHAAEEQERVLHRRLRDADEA